MSVIFLNLASHNLDSQVLKLPSFPSVITIWLHKLLCFYKIWHRYARTKKLQQQKLFLSGLLSKSLLVAILFITAVTSDVF